MKSERVRKELSVFLTELLSKRPSYSVCPLQQRLDPIRTVWASLSSMIYPENSNSCDFLSSSWHSRLPSWMRKLETSILIPLVATGKYLHHSNASPQLNDSSHHALPSASVGPMAKYDLLSYQLFQNPKNGQKEVMNGRPDLLKGSYYANIVSPEAAPLKISEQERKQFPEYYGTNICEQSTSKFTPPIDHSILFSRARWLRARSN